MRTQRTGQCHELRNLSSLDLSRAALQMQVQGRVRAPHPVLVRFQNRFKKHL